jgi:hypothetical protein
LRELVATGNLARMTAFWSTRSPAGDATAVGLHERNYQPGLLRWKTEIKYPIVPKTHDLRGD